MFYALKNNALYHVSLAERGLRLDPCKNDQEQKVLPLDHGVLVSNEVTNIIYKPNVKANYVITALASVLLKPKEAPRHE